MTALAHRAHSGSQSTDGRSGNGKTTDPRDPELRLERLFDPA
ncbi:MAG: hypothetical protein QOG46_1371, partial [Pseudonocardiales bacterium]|nr:hypothetical protein [Pseudonocardiales bacterium]